MNGDITLEALRRCQRASKVISPFIFAVFDVSFRRYNVGGFEVSGDWWW